MDCGLLVGGGLVLAGFAAENFAVHRWMGAGRPASFDALTALSGALPAAGLALIAMGVF